MKGIEVKSFGEERWKYLDIIKLKDYQYPKFYDNLFLFVGLTTLGKFNEFLFVGLLNWVPIRFNH